MTPPGEVEYRFTAEQDSKKFLYLQDNVVKKVKIEEEKSDNLETYLDGEAFSYYFHKFPEDNESTEKPKSLQNMQAALSDKFSTKKTEAEVIKEAENLVYKCYNVKKFFLKAIK